MEFSLLDKIVLCVAKRGSGKSYLCRWLLKQQHGHFAKIFCVSPTEKVNHHWAQIIDKTCIFDTYNDTWLHQLVEKMTDVNEGKTQRTPGFKRVLVVLDDCVADTDFHHSAPSLRICVARGRHIGISVILLTQSCKGVDPFFRSNADFVLLQMLNTASLGIAAEEWSACGFSKKDFIALHKQCTNDYGFLVISQNAGAHSDDANEYYGIIRCPASEFK